jgi:hypothetical protein
MDLLHAVKSYDMGPPAFLAVRRNPKEVLLDFLHCNNNMADQQTCEVGSKVAPLTIRPYNDVYGNRFSDNPKLRTRGPNYLYNVK